ncbi:MAG: DUF1028 domain-containing protein [Thermoanaerobaculia bacterium]
MILILILLLIPSITFSTYSIVAWDGEEMGVAVQSHWFSVGSVVGWAEAGVGVVATQSFVNPSYGYMGIEMMKKGFSAEETLKALLAIDEGRDVRQVAILDKYGKVSSFTGKNCIKYASHLTGEGFSVQANIMRQEGVPEAMAEAFRKTKGTLAERMIEALKAAEEKGGDLRGKQSASIKIVKVKAGDNPFQNVVLDLRVEDSEEPIKELERLYKIQKAYSLMDKEDIALSKKDIKNALKFYSEALNLYRNDEIVFWVGLSFYLAGEREEGKKMLKPLVLEKKDWMELLRRLVPQGMIKEEDLNFIIK